MSGSRGLSAGRLPNWLERVAGPTLRREELRRPARIAMLAGSLALTAVVYATFLPQFVQGDAYAYYSAWQGGLYDSGALGDPHAYLYSPAFAQLIWPLTLLPWEAFYVAWTLLLLGVLTWLVGPHLLGYALVLFYPATLSVSNGNIHLLMAAVVAVGIRAPWAWSAALLTKITPAIGLTWFLARREWGQLALALGATAGVAGVSFVLAPTLWREWTDVLFASVGRPGAWPSADVPLLVRLPLAALIVSVAGVTDRRWLLAVGVVAGSPIVGLETGVILLAIVYWARAAGATLPRQLGVLLLVTAGWLSFVVLTALLGLKGGPGI